MDNPTGRKLVVDAAPETRAGKHASAAIIASRDGEARIDFIEIDGTPDEGDFAGVLSARIFMSLNDLAALRDSIDEHMKGHGTDVDA